MAPPLLDARNLSKSYGSRPVLRAVSLSLCAGEGLALVGPNGSGKTTLLCLLAGVLPADEGVALLHGRPTREPNGRKRLAFVPQDSALYDGLSGREHLALFGRLHGLRGAALAERIDVALSAAGLERDAARRAGAYSGGMRRRLSLACALVHAPSLLLLDEPFEGVDEGSRRHLLAVLAASKQSGVALLLSTHRPEEVSALCERCCVMGDGRIVAERMLSTPEDVRELPIAQLCTSEERA